jgi:predicted nucleic acid-binding protein
VGLTQAAREVIVIADAGPILHLFWVGAARWALPADPIHVVEAVWREIESHDAAALRDDRFIRTVVGTVALARAPAGLDPGETEAIALALTSEDPLVLCDEADARDACESLGIPVTGSIGLILRAVSDGRASRDCAQDTLRALPGSGRLHISAEILALALSALDGEP